MEFNEYQVLAARTDNNNINDERLLRCGRLLNAAIGLSGEAGELLDEVKKIVFHGHNFDQGKLEKELGDILWYAAKTAREIRIALDDVAEANIEKLRNRYPEGFSEHKSRERDD